MPASSRASARERAAADPVDGRRDGGAAAAENLACSDLRRMVTSPGGTAAAGLAEMERRGVRGAIIDGVTAAMRRAGELG